MKTEVKPARVWSDLQWFSNLLVAGEGGELLGGLSTVWGPFPETDTQQLWGGPSNLGTIVICRLRGSFCSEGTGHRHALCAPRCSVAFQALD